MKKSEIRSFAQKPFFHVIFLRLAKVSWKKIKRKFFFWPQEKNKWNRKSVQKYKEKLLQIGALKIGRPRGGVAPAAPDSAKGGGPRRPQFSIGGLLPRPPIQHRGVEKFLFTGVYFGTIVTTC